MLKHEENSETLARPAAQVRVTPEELAAAIARIEARQGGMEGTIPLGEAVRELGLNATPEELLREIEAGRARPQENHLRAPVPKSNRVGIGAVFGLALIMFGGMVAFLRTPAISPPIADSPAVVAVFAPQAAPKPISLDLNLMVQDASDKIVLLSEVGDDQPVKCFYDNDSANFQSYSPEDNSAKEDWTLIKHGGQIYVRGWIDPMSDQAIQKNGVNVGTWESNYKDSDPSHTSHKQITLPLKGFQVGNGGDLDKEFHAVNIDLDKYAYEKWSP